MMVKEMWTPPLARWAGTCWDCVKPDGSGVVCIPAEHAERIADLARRYDADDKLAAAELGKGLTFREAMAKFQRI